MFVHVRPQSLAAAEVTFTGDEYERAVELEFDRFIAAVNLPEGVALERVKLEGKVAPTLLSFADAIDADLIVMGTEGSGFAKRMLVGSVATRVIRHSGRALLVTPPAEGNQPEER